MRRKKGWRHWLKEILIIALAALFFLLGALTIWASTLQLPDVSSFNPTPSQSTKIYDRTGKVLLYDAGTNIRRTVVPLTSISPNLQNATVAIEDSSFYEHGALRFSSIARAFLVDLTTFSLSQGGSTITQQVVKNSLLNQDKTVARKIKEWILSIKLEEVLSKQQILEAYLNEIPYGGNIYGAEQASESYFGTSSANLDLAQSAYLAAIPQAPTYYSPYGNNRAALDARKNQVLDKMLSLGMITEVEHDQAKAEVVAFKSQSLGSVEAPWFVQYVESYLEQKYGADTVENGGLTVITTLDANLEAETEQAVQTYALQNEKNFNASNAAAVIIDPTTGEILTMVGSRNYFDPTIDGQFNVAIAHNRQPGSTFKPFVYATAFEKGYTPDTVLFDVPTQFTNACPADSTSSDNGCYSPVNFDGSFHGPVTLRYALANSLDIPAVKLLYLAGITDSLTTATDMGITGLQGASQYGLSLALGSAQVSLLDMTSAYGAFAAGGIRNAPTGILSVTDGQGNVLEQYEPNPQTVLPSNIAATINDILSDNVARAPDFGLDSPLYIPERPVAVKTGTTNDYRDAWTIGYAPNMVVGTWAGNNDDTPMAKQIAGFIVAPMWHVIMEDALTGLPIENFAVPPPESPDLKPVMLGIWQGTPVSSTTPTNGGTIQVVTNVHSILYWVDKNNPLGPAPANPADDPEFNNWEYSVDQWAAQNGYVDGQIISVPN